MKSPLFEDIDYVHYVDDLKPEFIQECFWDSSIADGQAVRFEFPLHLRRERYHRSSEIVHRHRDFLALYLVRGGRGIREVNGYSHSMARGDVFIMAEGATHCFRSPVDLTIDAVYFQCALWTPREWDILCQMADLAEYLTPESDVLKMRGRSDHFGHLSPEPHARVESILANMRRELESGSLPQHLAARGRFYALLVQLGEWHADKTFSPRPARGAGIAEVLSFCESNFHRALTNEQLAGLMHFSEGHFREVFTREVGMPPGAYLQHLRLQHAQNLLTEKCIPITDIARLSGFGNSTQLGRAFKKAFGTSPLEFRKKRGGTLHL